MVEGISVPDDRPRVVHLAGLSGVSTVSWPVSVTA